MSSIVINGADISSLSVKIKMINDEFILTKPSDQKEWISSLLLNKIRGLRTRY